MDLWSYNLMLPSTHKISLPPTERETGWFHIYLKSILPCYQFAGAHLQRTGETMAPSSLSAKPRDTGKEIFINAPINI